MTIDWKHVGQPRFDEIVEALLHRIHLRADEFYAIDGRGGDEGKDFYIRRDQYVTIVQLKYFPEGLSNGFRPRRKQIKKSFDRAMKGSPSEWALVFPGVLTPGERTFVEGLSEKKHVNVSIMDRTALNSEMAERPDLLAAFTRDGLRDAAKDFDQEKALLLDPRDLDVRIRALGKTVDNVDPHWTWDFMRMGNTNVRTLRAKTPHAADVSPIGIHFKTGFKPEHDRIQAAFERVMDYGTSETVTLPAEVVSAYKVTGPAFVAHKGDEGDVELTIFAGDYAGPTFPIELRFVNPETKQVVSSHTGTALRGGQSRKGRSMETKFHGCMAITLLFPDDQDALGGMSISLDVTGAEPPRVLRVLGLKDALEGGHHVEIYLDGKHLNTIDLTSQVGILSDEQEADIRVLKSLAEDLDVVQRQTNQFFPIPAEISGLDRINLRCIRLLLEGKVITMPRANILRLRLNGQIGPGIEEFLSGKPGTMFFDHEDYRFDLFDHHLPVGHLRMFNPKIEVRNPAPALKALLAGNGADYPIEIKPCDGMSFRMFLPRLWDIPDAELVASPWGLDGFDELPDVGA